MAAPSTRHKKQSIRGHEREKVVVVSQEVEEEQLPRNNTLLERHKRCNHFLCLPEVKEEQRIALLLVPKLSLPVCLLFIKLSALPKADTEEENIVFNCKTNFMMWEKWLVDEK